MNFAISVRITEILQHLFLQCLEIKPIIEELRRDSVINAVLLFSSIFSICLIYNVSIFFIIIFDIISKFPY
jgi:hypothetical protein